MFYVKLVLMVLWSLAATVALFPLLPFTAPTGRAFCWWQRVMAWGVLRIARIRVEMKGESNLYKSRPCVIMCNHQSAFDMVTFGSYSPFGAAGIGKKEIAWMPLIGWYFVLAGGFLIDRRNRSKAVDLLVGIAKRLKSSRRAVAIMPEGTRNPSGMGLLPFKKGGFHLAVAAQADICIVVSSPLAPIANFETRTLRPGTVQLSTLEPISVQGCTDADIDRLMEEVRGKMLAELETLRTEAR